MIAKKQQDFEPLPELEMLIGKIKRVGPELQVINGQSDGAEVIELPAVEDNGISFKDIAGMQ